MLEYLVSEMHIWNSGFSHNFIFRGEYLASSNWSFPILYRCQALSLLRSCDYKVLVGSQHKPVGAGRAFNQLRTAAAIEALHAAQFSKFDPLMLASTPLLADGLQSALRLMPKLGQRLTACAIWAQVCLAELDESIPNEAMTASLEPAICQLLPKEPHPYCSKSREQGMFRMVHLLIVSGINVGPSYIHPLIGAQLTYV